jgi:phospholipid/cholesterol/gamma-HCH transport system substrate-binding protein
MKKTTETIHKPREQFHRQYRNLFVGIFIAIPLIVLPCFLVVTFLKGEMFEKSYVLHTEYPNASGLVKGAAVTVIGMKVGYITDVTLNQSNSISVTMKIREQYNRLIHKNSIARLQQKNIAFGDWGIELCEATADSPPARNGDTLKSETLTPIAQTLEQVNLTIGTFQKILQNILDGKGTVGRLFQEDTVVNIAQDIGRQTATVMSHVNTTLFQVDSIMHKVNAMGDRGTSLSDSVIVISGKVSTLITDVNTLVNSAQTMTKDVPALMGKVQDDMAQVDMMIRGLQKNWLVKSFTGNQADPLLNGSK